jgi:hypothetical protein
MNSAVIRPDEKEFSPAARKHPFLSYQSVLWATTHPRTEGAARIGVYACRYVALAAETSCVQ